MKQKQCYGQNPNKLNMQSVEIKHEVSISGQVLCFITDLNTGRSDRLPKLLLYGCGTCSLMSFSTIFQSYQENLVSDNERLCEMETCLQSR